MSKSFVNKALLGGAVAAGAAVWAIAPRTFSDKRRNYVPSIPDVWYAHRGLHDAGSGLTAQYANESGEYVALARRMAMKAGYGSPSVTGAIAPENSLAAFAAARPTFHARSPSSSPRPSKPWRKASDMVSPSSRSWRSSSCCT